MFLVKCKCGCLFTIKKEALSRSYLTCQNCRESIRLMDFSNVVESSKILEEDGATVSYIPDNAKIEVRFEA